MDYQSITAQAVRILRKLDDAFMVASSSIEHNAVSAPESVLDMVGMSARGLYQKTFGVMSEVAPDVASRFVKGAVRPGFNQGAWSYIQQSIMQSLATSAIPVANDLAADVVSPLNRVQDRLMQSWGPLSRDGVEPSESDWKNIKKNAGELLKQEVSIRDMQNNVDKMLKEPEFANVFMKDSTAEKIERILADNSFAITSLITRFTILAQRVYDLGVGGYIGRHIIAENIDNNSVMGDVISGSILAGIASAAPWTSGLVAASAGTRGVMVRGRK